MKLVPRNYWSDFDNMLAGFMQPMAGDMMPKVDTYIPHFIETDNEFEITAGMACFRWQKLKRRCSYLFA